MSEASKIQRQPVTSSNVESVGHDPATGTLAVKFLNNATIYHYAGVDAAKFQRLMESKSKGHFMRAEVIRQHPMSKHAQG